MDSIQYLLHEQIDKKKWDDCINSSINRLIYAKSFYLDALAANWNAIVLNDYEAVMPLTWKKKWGITYLYQPAFIQQGGIFSAPLISSSLINEFIETAFTQFKFAEITFNYLNDISNLNNAEISMRTNFVLPLTETYHQISARYHSSVTKDLKRSRQFNLQYQSTDDYRSVVELYQKLYRERLPFFSDADFSNFILVCKKMEQENNLVVRKSTDTNGAILAATVLLKDGNRLYNIISCITESGKYKGANHFLYDKVIQEFCNADLLLDFEGSDVKGIADFYRRFNTKNQPYPFFKLNRLNPVIKLFKR